MPGKPIYEELEQRIRKLGRKLDEHKQAEATLLEREEKFRALIEAVSDWIYEVDLNGVYTYASPKVKDVMVYSPEEVIGRPIVDRCDLALEKDQVQNDTKGRYLLIAHVYMKLGQ